MRPHFPSIKPIEAQVAINGAVARSRHPQLVVVVNGHPVPYTLPVDDRHPMDATWLRAVRDRVMRHDEDGVVVGVHWRSFVENVLYHAQEALLANRVSSYWLRLLMGPAGLYVLVADSRCFGPDPAPEDQSAILQQVTSASFDSVPSVVDLSNLWPVLMGAHRKSTIN